MNFQELNKVETADKYIDIILAAGRKSKSAGAQGKSKLERIKKGEYARFSGVRKATQKQCMIILNGFPSLDTLPEFYQQLIQHTIDRRHLKHCLAAVKWTMDKTSQFERVYREKLQRSNDLEFIRKIKNEGIGRICSTFKAIKKELIFLEESRKIMKAYPAIKTKLFSVAIAGFPNVGKSTLLGKVSSATPKIADYAFTTRTINIGYSIIKRHKIQFLDTPGTLNRLNVMNAIEKQAYMVLRYVADIIVYVVDLTEGYDLDKQIKLLKKMESYDKPVVVYLSKLDILNDKKKVASFCSAHPSFTIYTSLEEIQEFIKKQI